MTDPGAEQGAKGRFITLEGGEGAGKSTQALRLKNWLESLGIATVLTREPGGAPGAEDIRRLLVEGAPGRWDGVTETLLHFAARRDHLRHTIWPALSRGEWVVCDRFADSTVAYQGYGHGVDIQMIQSLYAATVGDFAPDVTFILDLPLEAGLARARVRGGAENRYEDMDRAFHERLRDGFLRIAAQDSARCVVVNALDEPDAVFHRLCKTVRERLLHDPVDPTA